MPQPPGLAAQLHFTPAAGQPCSVPLPMGIAPVGSVLGLPASLAAITDLRHVYGEGSLHRLQPGDMHGLPWAETGLYSQCWMWRFEILPEEGRPSHLPIPQVFGKWSAAFRFLNPRSSPKHPLPPRPLSPSEEWWCLSPWMALTIQQALNCTRVWLLERVCPVSVVQADAVWGSFSTEFVCKQHTAPDC